MNKLGSILITILIVLNSCSLAQDFPGKKELLKIIGDLNMELRNNNDVEMNVNTKKQFRFVNSKFTNQQRKECLVICPVLYGNNTRDLVLFFQRDSTNKWKLINTYIEENAPYSDDIVDTMDVDNDKIIEIFIRGNSMIRGYEKAYVKIITFKNGKDKVIYSIESFSFPEDEEYIGGLTVGDVMYEDYEINFTDLNGDGVKEIVEKKYSGLILKKEKDLNGDFTIELEDEIETNNYRLVNGAYVVDKK